MEKFKAAFIHFLISITIISFFFLLVFYIWYPKPFFDISGVSEPLKLMILVDVILGPLLTFIVYKKGKKYLMLDFVLIVIIQLVALGYGAYTIYGGKPSMVVMYNGEFRYMAEKFSKHEQLTNKELTPHLFSKPILVHIPSSGSLSIYNTYIDMLPLDDYEVSLKPYSYSVETMLAKFTNKKNVIQLISQKYIDQEIAYFKLDKEGSTFYVAYSITKNTIVDYIKF